MVVVAALAAAGASVAAPDTPAALASEDLPDPQQLATGKALYYR